MRKCIAISIILSLAFLTGCKTTEPYRYYDDIYVVDSQKPQVADGLDEEVQPVEEKIEQMETVVETKDDTVGYQKYYEYMLEKEGGNVMFSPESLNIAFAMHAELLNDKDKALFEDFLAHRDYLSYQGTDTFKIANRLWVNKDCDFHAPDTLKDLAYFQDMTDEAEATAFKNQYVAQQTNNFITETPTVFNSDTVCDSMNILYFKDTWLGGDKVLDSFSSEFTNDDGTKSDVYMFNDEGSCVRKTDDAVAYTMTYNDGFTITFILPNEGVAVDDIDINGLLTDDTNITNTKVYAKIPEFEVNSVFKSRFSDFGLPLQPMFADGITTESLDPPLITQVTRIKVDHKGTEAAAVSEVLVMKNAAGPMEEPYYFVLDRPFVYYICDTVNDDVAFMGVVKTLAE